MRKLSTVKVPESQTSAQAITEAACRVPPKRLTQPTPVPVVCFLRDDAVNDDMWACIEGHQGTADNPQSGALAQCNADKAAIEAIFRPEQERGD